MNLLDKLSFLPENDIVGDISRSCRFREGFALTQGRRTYMEDFIRVKGCFGLRPDTDLYCIFDGHDGHEAAEFATKTFPDILWDQLVDAGNSDDHEIDSIIFSLGVECCDNHSTIEQKRVAIALHRSFQKISESMEGKSGGTTALVALLLGEDLFVANVGDTRSILSCKKGKSIRVSTDHRPMASERERIEDMGGFISDMSVPRVNGILAISRALGDHDLASKGVICRPHIKFVPNFRESHRYLIMASDGLWDYVKEGEALKTVNDVLGYKVPAWRPRGRRTGDSSATPSSPFSSSTQSCSSIHSSPVAPSPPSSSMGAFCISEPFGQLAQSAPPPWENPTASHGTLSVSVDSHQKEEGVFDLDFDEGFGGEGEKERATGDDELVGRGSLDHSKLWEKLGMTPVATPSPPPKEPREGDGAGKEMSASHKLVELAFHQGSSHDNISVIVVNFAEI